MISQTSGHGDFRFLFELPRRPGGPLSHSEAEGIAAIADSPDEVRLRAREQLRQGASQIKLMGGGGVSSQYNPIESTQFTEPEIRAAVEAAEDWGTYVAVHAYTPRGDPAGGGGGRQVHRARPADRRGDGEAAGRRGRLVEPAAADLRRRGVRADEPGVAGEGAGGLRRDGAGVRAGARRYRVKTAWGADILFDPGAASRQGAYLAKMVRWYTPAEALKMATADNGELMALSGFINPYPGRLGVVQEGALADLLLVDGNPLEDIELVTEPERTFVVIMKDGVVYKDTVPR